MQVFIEMNCNYIEVIGFHMQVLGWLVFLLLTHETPRNAMKYMYMYIPTCTIFVLSDILLSL